MAEVTNYIDRLVAELCPDGVEYRPLGDVVEYAKKREKDGTGVHLYVGVENLKSDFLGCSPVNGSKGGIIFQKDDILLGNIRPYLKKMWLSNAEGVSSPDVLVLRIQENEEENIVAKYLYYILSSSKFVAYNISHSRGGKMPRGNKAKILEFEFPVPPTEIQEAIVEILDKFTNLEAELEARTLQYEYYRDSLFEALDCPHVPLGSLGVRNKGIAITASKMRTLEPGNKDVRIFAAGSTFVDTDSSFIPDKGILEGPAIIVKSRGHIGFEYYEGKFTHKNELWSYSLTSDLVEQKFIYYYLLTQAYHLHELARGKSVKLPQLAVKDTDELLVPVPSLEEQQRIVDILDRFDALTSSLSEGLPAELAVRRNQYEYYRDQLLSFPRKGENQ